MRESDRTQVRRSSSGGDPSETETRVAMSTVATVAVIAGFAGLLMCLFVLGDPVLRYLIPLAVGGAIARVIWVLARSARRRHLDMVVGALATAGASLYLFISFITDPSPTPAGT